MSDALGPGIFQSFLDYLFRSGDISVPTDYYERCSKIREMLDNDISGTINTILDYSVNSASEANYRIECSGNTLQKLLNVWLDKINLDIRGIPTGLQALSKEYFKERWEGSSFCILRVKDWEKITVDKVTIEVPTTMWFVNGESIYVMRPKNKNYTLGSDKFYLDKENKIKIPESDEEEIIIQKPYNRWFDQYATPYLIRKGVYKNWLGIKVLQDKSDEVISKFLPYLFVISKGTEKLFLEGDVNYSDDELKELSDNFKSEIQKYANQNGKTPTSTVPFDTKYEHLIPDLRKILSQELYQQGYRAILAGLGFIDMLEISPSRQEARMNPKAFISEINEGVSGFKSMLLEVIYLIEDRNKAKHPIMFSDKGKILIVNSPLRINVEQILDALRSGYDRGVASIESYQEILGLDPTTEKERRKKELDNGLEDLMYPHLIQNREDIPDRVIPAKPKKEKEENNEDQNKKKNTPETKTKTASIEEIAKCKKCGHEFDYLSVQEAGMGWVKCPKCEEAVTQEDLIIAPYDKDNPPAFLKKYPKGAQEVFIDVFNKSLPKGEDYAFPVAWSAMKRWLKKHGYKKVDNKWVKSEEETNDGK
jgi:predicted Zn-ribbon and HTH transcriptional regulator